MPKIMQPPKCSPDWTPQERLAYIRWMAEIMLDRIERDNPGMPLVAKRPVYDLMCTARLVAMAPPAFLEKNRAALEKAYDPENDRIDINVIGDPHEVLQFVI